jgi:hypothetical protein
MTDPNEPIYPEKDWANVPTFGLTKKEYFASQALIGLLFNEKNEYDEYISSETMAKRAVFLADKLINELNK